MEAVLSSTVVESMKAASLDAALTEVDFFYGSGAVNRGEHIIDGDGGGV